MKFTGKQRIAALAFFLNKEPPLAKESKINQNFARELCSPNSSGHHAKFFYLQVNQSTRQKTPSYEQCMKTDVYFFINNIIMYEEIKLLIKN